MKIFSGLAKEVMETRRIQAMSPAGAPQQILPDKDGRLQVLVTCPKCHLKGLPYANALDAAWTAQCNKCGCMFAFHPHGQTPAEAIAKQAHRSRHPLIRERGEGKTRHIDGNKHAEWDLERRQLGRRAYSRGLL